MNILAEIKKLYINATEHILNITSTENRLNLNVYDGIPEAPDDGKAYARQFKKWQEVEGITVDDTVTEESTNPVSSRGLFAFFAGLLDDLQQWITNNFLSSVSTTNELTGDGKSSPLGVNEIAIEKITGLRAELDAKLQKLVDVTLVQDVTSITYDIVVKERLLIIIDNTFKDNELNSISSRTNIRLNGVFDNVYSWGAIENISVIRLLNSSNEFERGILDIKIVEENYYGYSIANREAMAHKGIGFSQVNSVEISSVTTYIAAGSKIVIYGY